MESISLVKIIALVSIFFALLLSFFLVTVNTKNTLANTLLASFTVFCAIDISGVFLVNYTFIFQFSKTLIFLIFPSFYLYVLSICYFNFRLHVKHLLHSIPTVVYIIAIIVILFNGQDHLLVKLEWFMGAILLKLQAMVYVVAIIVVLKRYKRIYLENYTANNMMVYSWLSHTVLLFAITFPVTIIRELLAYSGFHAVLNWLTLLLVAIAFLMFCWFVLKALYNPELFRGIDISMQSSVKLQRQKALQYSEIDSNTNTNAEIKAQVDFLSKYMEGQEPFVDPDITLQDLASQINIPSRELSVLINLHIGQHFFDFVNSYRIKKAMQILRNHSKEEYTIQQVLYDVGFNSKSSFNTAFKKHAGLTPTEYRNKI